MVDPADIYINQEITKVFAMIRPTFAELLPVLCCVCVYACIHLCACVFVTVHMQACVCAHACACSEFYILCDFFLSSNSDVSVLEGLDVKNKVVRQLWSIGTLGE